MLKAVSYNIQYGVGRDRKRDLARVMRAIEGADIVALQEVERFWKKSGMTDQPAEIAALWPDYHWVYGPFFDVDASFRDAGGRLVNRRRQHGTMILSRWPIASSRLWPLPKMDSATGFGMQMGALEAVIDRPGKALRVFSVHFNSLGSEERQLQAQALMAIYKRTLIEGPVWSGADTELDGTDWANGETPPPAPRDCLILGDFNCEPDSPEYAILCPNRTGRYGSFYYHDSLADGWEVAGGDGGGETFLAAEVYGYPFDMRIDYGFVSGGLVAHLKRVRVDRDAIGSDHQPVWLEFDLP